METVTIHAIDPARINHTQNHLQAYSEFAIWPQAGAKITILTALRYTHTVHTSSTVPVASIY